MTEITIRREKWLRGDNSHLMTADGCGCVLGHYLVAKGVPVDAIKYRYGLEYSLVPFAEQFPELGDLDHDPAGHPFFRPNEECVDIIDANDGAYGIPRRAGDPFARHAAHERLVVTRMRRIGCRVRFV